MPEGDSIHRARRRLAPVLEGQVVEAFRAPTLRGPRPQPGRRIEAVRAHGKHLLVDFERHLTLDVHLGMSGSWRTHPPGELPSAALADPRLRVHIATPAGHAVCYAAPTVRTFSRSAGTDPLAGLGPELTSRTPDLEQAVARARTLRRPEDPLVDVLLDQRVSAGIGNIFKNEALHRAGLAPLTPLGALTDEELEGLLALTSRMLERSARLGRRAGTGTPEGGFAVYRRWRRPCRRCGTPIERAYLGEPPRSTYWCPRCQPAAAA